MFDRQTYDRLNSTIRRTKSSVAICADRDPSEITNFIKGGRISSPTEAAIVHAVSDIEGD